MSENDEQPDDMEEDWSEVESVLKGLLDEVVMMGAMPVKVIQDNDRTAQDEPDRNEPARSALTKKPSDGIPVPILGKDDSTVRAKFPIESVMATLREREEDDGGPSNGVPIVIVDPMQTRRINTRRCEAMAILSASLPLEDPFESRAR